MVGDKAVRRFLRSLHGRTSSRRSFFRRAASPAAPSLRSQAFPWVHGVLFAPASSVEFLPDEPASCSYEKPGGRFTARGDTFWGAPLAQSRADSAHVPRRSHHGLVLFARAQYHSTRYWTRHPRHAGLVVVSGGMASRHACWTGLLLLPSALAPRAYKFRWLYFAVDAMFR